MNHRRPIPSLAAPNTWVLIATVLAVPGIGLLLLGRFVHFPVLVQIGRVLVAPLLLGGLIALFATVFLLFRRGRPQA
jgi:hypothetical protein